MKISGGFAQLLRVVATLAFIGASGMWDSAAKAELTSLRIVDYATMPQTGLATGNTANSWYMARANFMAEEPREEPGGGNRFFVNDLNGPLYILDKTTKQFTTYLDFNGRVIDPDVPGVYHPGMFREFVFASGFANGLITFQFDPAYQTNGKFYTVHMEEPGHLSGTSGPVNTNFPGLNTAGYTTTTSIDAPGGVSRHTVLIEWTDTNINNTSFEGTAREVMRLDMVGSIHPLGDLIFNPLAGPGDPDWRVMYLAVGDGSAGEGSGTTRLTPQRLDTVNGKILRIIPDLSEHTGTSTISSNGQYRIPNDNPSFTTSTNSAIRDELYAVGLRNPHRISWDVDPANSDPNTNSHIIVNDIGLHSWEEVNIISGGGNYGYSQREGNQVLVTNTQTGPLPNPDVIPVQITGTTTLGTVVPRYPVAQYGHEQSPDPIKGDSISSGYVYRGSKIPQLYGKYLFGEITTGQILYADFEEMLAADDGDPTTMAEIHSLDILWDDPNDGAGELLFPTDFSDGVRGPLFAIIERTYEFRGGTDPNLPGSADVTGGNGRADIRIQIDEDGELYILSKSDGMIRQIIGPPRIAGDYDHDGDVDAADYGVWRESFGDPVPVDGLWADGNEDGMVDLADYVVWRNAFTGAAAGSSLTNVPEPASGVLVFIAILLCAGAHRGRVADVRREAASA